MAVKAPPEETPAHLCAGCGGKCCRLRVDLTAFDIIRIAVIAGKDAADFVQLVEAKEDDAFAVRCLGTAAKAVLKHRPDGSCTFLNGSDVRGCDIEDAKPAICLAYPFALRDGTAYIRHDVLCPMQNRRHADLKKMSRQSLEDCEWEAQFYKEIVEDWNMMARGDEPFDRFFIFAGDEISINRWPLVGGRLRSLIRSLRRRLRTLRAKQESPQASR